MASGCLRGSLAFAYAIPSEEELRFASFETNLLTDDRENLQERIGEHALHCMYTALYVFVYILHALHCMYNALYTLYIICIECI